MFVAHSVDGAFVYASNAMCGCGWPISAKPSSGRLDSSMAIAAYCLFERLSSKRTVRGNKCSRTKCLVRCTTKLCQRSVQYLHNNLETDRAMSIVLRCRKS